MPYPKKGESRNDYVARAIPMIKKEHPGKSQSAVVGQAEGMYSSYKGSKRPKRHRKPMNER